MSKVLIDNNAPEPGGRPRPDVPVVFSGRVLQLQNIHALRDFNETQPAFFNHKAHFTKIADLLQRLFNQFNLRCLQLF